jgi:large subunit ribosomal protein L19
MQVYEGVVSGRKGTGHRETITVRKVSYGVGVERIFPLHSGSIQKVVVVREGDVSRAKLYYLRERSGRSSRLTDKMREVRQVGPSIAPASATNLTATSQVSESLPFSEGNDSPIAVASS